MTEHQHFDVFVSHTSTDRPWVRAFSHALEDAGIKAWTDALMTPGVQVDEQIESALRESRTLVLVLSPDSVSNPRTLFELGAAFADDKTVIPVMARDVPSGQLKLLANRKIVTEDSPEKAANRVAEVIARATH